MASKEQRALFLRYQVCFLNSLQSTSSLSPCDACGAQKAFSLTLAMPQETKSLVRVNSSSCAPLLCADPFSPPALLGFPSPQWVTIDQHN